jgi:drug/metabolite transporter (DMT)-like permease
MKRNGEFLVLISILAFSVSDIFDKVAVVETDPLLATLIKCIIICLFVFFVGLRERFNFKGARYFVASGLISEIVGSASFMQSLRFGINVALPVIQSQVIFTAIFSYLLLRERISKKAYAGIVVIFTGLAILAYSQFSYVEAQDPLSGVFFALVASIGWGAGAVLWKMGLEHGASSSTGLIVHYLSAIVVISAVMLFRGIRFSVSSSDIVNLAIASLLDGILGMLALIRSMRYISATRAQTLKSLYPILACVLASIIFREPITGAMASGMVIATVGVGLFENGKKVNASLQ